MLSRQTLAARSSSTVKAALSAPVSFQQRRTMILKASTLANGKGKLFEGQDSLPSLPVPPLEQTLKKYLRSTVPHQTNESLKKTEAAVESALSGSDHELFKTLQKRLQDRAASPESEGNWLASWWNTAAYMCEYMRPQHLRMMTDAHLTPTATASIPRPRRPLRLVLLLSQGRQAPHHWPQARRCPPQGCPLLPQARRVRGARP